MVVYSRARKEIKKVPFLKALARLGTITDAAKAVRISRDAVHDWRRHDPSFATAFLIAKKAFKDRDMVTIDDALDFFTDAIRPFVPAVLWPRIHSRIEIAASDRKFRMHGATSVPSRSPQVGAPLLSAVVDERANSSAGNDALHHRFYS